MGGGPHQPCPSHPSRFSASACWVVVGCKIKIKRGGSWKGTYLLEYARPRDSASRDPTTTTCRGRDIPVRDPRPSHDDTTDGHLHDSALVGAGCVPVECSHGSQAEDMLMAKAWVGGSVFLRPGKGMLVNWSQMLTLTTSLGINCCLASGA